MHHAKVASALELSELKIRRSRSFQVSVESLILNPGTTACLTGANGSGKTSLLEGIAGIIRPTNGSIIVCGNIQDGTNSLPKEDIGYVPDDDGWIIAELTADEYFRLLDSFSSKASGLEEARRLAKTLSFTAFDQQAGSLSHGNRKKVQLIAALMHHPKVLIVDELRNGLDPLSIKVAEELLKEEAKKGTAILAASHDLWWSERFAKETLILVDGRIQVQSKTADIVKRWGSLENLFLQTYAKEPHE